MVRGERLDAARAAGRQLLADILRARLALVTTDDIRHWILERDPLVFARRRHVREPGAAGWRYLDPALAAIAHLAEPAWPHGSGLVAELMLDYFRPGAVPVAAQAAPEPERPPPLEDIEEQLGDLADGLEWPGEPDYSRLGSVGDTYPLPPRPDEESPKIHAVFTTNDDTISRVSLRSAPRRSAGGGRGEADPPGAAACRTGAIA